jgi:hypothetical protein
MALSKDEHVEIIPRCIEVAVSEKFSSHPCIKNSCQNSNTASLSLDLRDVLYVEILRVHEGDCCLVGYDTE